MGPSEDLPLPEDDSVPPELPAALQELTDELEDLIEACRPILFSDRILISSDRLLDLVDAVREAIPPVVLEAERVLDLREQLLQDAHDEAAALLAGATQEMEHRVQEHPVLQAAHLQAERIVDQSRRAADERMASAEAHVRQLFRHLEDLALGVAAQLQAVRQRAADGRATPIDR
jgi:vacuolar-type H+-ATPase subunit H